MSQNEQLYERTCRYARETAMYESILAALEWDERTMLPAAAGEYRADQVTLLSGLIHQRRTNPEYGAWLAELLAKDSREAPADEQSANVRELHREYQKRVKLPQSLVEELTRLSVLGQQAWVEARRNNDFASFAPVLEKTFHLKRQQADCLGYVEHPYDALLDEYEPGETTRRVEQVLGALRERLVPLIQAIAGSARRAPVDMLRRSFPIPAQERFGRKVAEALGFEFRRGRLDITHHPFCTSLGPHDCRITTRYDEHWFPGAFFGILHEAGHGIYDQGLRPEQFGLPAGTYLSLGIHESQSRMWENLVGRDRSFWTHFYSSAVATFPEALSDVGVDDFHFAINRVEPSLIRVEADEATYNLHIVARFELERALLNQELRVADLPAAWNDQYEKLLGIRPPTDADGVLQDVHWSAGLVGYFPTYSLGNLYAAQFFEQADRELGGLPRCFTAGDFLGLKNWLREKVHRHGRCLSAAALIQQVSGQPLTSDALLRQLRGKFEPLYAL